MVDAQPAPRIAALLLILLLCLSGSGDRAALAESLPDRTTLLGLDGGLMTEADLSTGVTILVVWASWSPRCRDVVPRIEALDKSWSSRARVASVVFQEEPAEVRRFLDGKDLHPPVYIDTTGAFSKKYTVTTLPFLLVFDGGESAFRGKLPIDPDPVIERALRKDS